VEGKGRSKKPVVSRADIDRILRSLDDRGWQPRAVTICTDGTITLSLVDVTAQHDSLDAELARWESRLG
jgi:hypothetical protein